MGVQSPGVQATPWVNRMAAAIRRNLPHGARLPRLDWEARHRAVVVVAALQGLVAVWFGVWQDWDPVVALAEGLAITLIALAAWPAWGGRRWRSGLAAFSCVAASAAFVQFSGGYIEAHFHFFVMVALIALYQDWVPFLLAIFFVALDHGVVGTLQPTWVYNHHAAWNSPWEWGAIHASLVLAECAALVSTWNVAERAAGETTMVLEAAGEGIIGVDTHGRIRFANSAGCALSAMPAPDVMGAAWDDAFPSSLGWRVDWQGPAASGELLFDAKHSVVAVAWSRAPMQQAGITRGSVITLRDTTEWHARERDLRNARDEARKADLAKSRFLANMSHEIRTPLNAVIGMSELLLDTNLEGRQVEYARTIKTSGEHLLLVINDILDFSKLESGSVQMELAPVNVANLIEDALDLVAVPARQKGLDLGCIMEPDVPAGILGDEGRLRQVLLNLLSNGVKFTSAGSVFAHVSVTEQQGAKQLRIAVKDTGIGIPPDRYDRLFKSFSQVDASTTRTHGGTGLGLAISRSLIRAMGGDITVDSKPGQGSEFVVTLPIQVASAPSSELDGVHLERLDGLRVLVVDDTEPNRTIMRNQLKPYGAVVHEVASGIAAVEFLKEHTVDVVILDYHMPGMDGVAAGQAVRQLPGGKDLVMILATSVASPPTKHVAALKFQAVLTKPIRKATLLSALVGEFKSSPQAGPRALTAGPLQILLAEDNPTNQLVAQRMLESMGYHADVVSNGVGAVEALEHHSYDLVLMDLQMPEMDGFEATKRILAMTNRKPLIVALTANALEGDREACLAAGMDDYVSKPIRVDELRRVLAEATKRAKT